MQRILLPVAVALGLLAGCYTQGDVGVGYSYGYAAPAPAMYYVSPGVSVVAYSDYPVFYSDNYYWRYDGGIWYRSSYYNGGWVAWHDVPYRVRSIDRPYRYARFTPGRGWSRETYRGPVVRDHRTYRRGYDARYQRTAPAPTTRDHRTYRAPRTYQAPRSTPTVRDHRTYSAPRRTFHSSGSSRPARRDHRR